MITPLSLRAIVAGFFEALLRATGWSHAVARADRELDRIAAQRPSADYERLRSLADAFARSCGCVRCTAFLDAHGRQP